MAARFLKDADYDMQIRQEIKRLLDGSAPGDAQPPPKLLRAESTALSQMKKWLSGRYDTDAIFTPDPLTGEDPRDQFIVTSLIDIALYHLYSQTQHRDVPEHRKNRYQDAIDWLQAAGKGENYGGDLPALEQEQFDGDVRISSKPPEDHTW